MLRKFLLGGSAFALAVGAAGIAAAQQASTEDEIVVTARRTSESIQSVPVSVAAFSNEALREASISNINDLQFQTTGVFLQGSAAPQNASYYIRGQGLSIAGFGLPGVITYSSEVPLPAYGSNNPQYDMASIQVLKGPQGTLFGRNTTGGAVLLQPNTPTYALEGYVQGSIGDYNLREIEGAVNIPLAENVAALRIAAHSVRQDGWTDNRGIGGDMSDQHTDDIRVALLLDPTSWLSNTLTVDYSETDSNGGAQVFYDVNAGSAYYPLFAAVVDPLDARQEGWGPYVNASNVDTFLEFESLGVTNRTEVELGEGLSLINIFGYRATKNYSLSNIDGVEVPLLDSYRFFEYEQYTDELQLRGETGNLRWLLGAFYLDNSPNGPTGSQNTIFFTPANAGYRFYSETSKAVYGNVNFNLDSIAEGLSFSAGYRHTWDEASLCDGAATSTTNFGLTEDDCRAGAAGFASTSTNSAEFDGGTWTIGLDWQVTDDVFLYATSRRGYRSGGINSPVLDPASPLANFQTYEPDTTTDVELGVRSDWDIGSVRGRTNVSIFRAYTEDAQRAVVGFQTLPDGMGGCLSLDTNCDPSDDPFDTGLLVNYGDASVNGVEAEFTLWPTEGLSFSLGVSLQDFKTESINPMISTLAPILASLGFDPNAIPFDASPETSITAGVRWELPVNPDLGEFVFNADYFWVDDTPIVAVTVPAYDVTNMRLDWNGIMGSSFDLGVFARNVFEEEYVLTTANPTALGPFFSVAYGAPRMVGAQLRYSWGQ